MTDREAHYFLFLLDFQLTISTLTVQRSSQRGKYNKQICPPSGRVLDLDLGDVMINLGNLKVPANGGAANSMRSAGTFQLSAHSPSSSGVCYFAHADHITSQGEADGGFQHVQEFTISLTGCSESKPHNSKVLVRGKATPSMLRVE